MTLSRERLALPAPEVQEIEAVENYSIAVETLEHQFQNKSACETQQVQACQLEPGDRVLYKERVMRVGSIQPSSTRPYGFFVSLLPVDYDNSHTDYKRWQAHLRQHRLEVPSNWFTPWERIQPESTSVALPQNPFESEAERSAVRVVQLTPTKFHCEDLNLEQGCVIWIEHGLFHAPTVVWPELARRAIAAVKSYLEENPLYLEYNRHQACYCVYRNDEGGRYIGNTSGTTTAEALLQTDQMMQKVRAGVLDKFGI